VIIRASFVQTLAIAKGGKDTLTSHNNSRATKRHPAAQRGI